MTWLQRSRGRFWRFASPSTLLLALLLFPLPWVRIQCTGPRNPPPVLKRLGVPEPVAEIVSPPTAVVMLTQSGWQAACGECMRDAAWDKELRESMISTNAQDRKTAQRWETFEQQLLANLHGSWLMTAYAIVMLTAIVTGVTMAPCGRRSTVLALLVATALSLVTVQYLQGFPLAQAYLAVPWEAIAQDGQRPPAQEIEEARGRDIRYTHWFWLAQQLTIVALCLLPAEWWLARRTTPGAAAPPCAMARTPTDAMNA